MMSEHRGEKGTRTREDEGRRSSMKAGDETSLSGKITPPYNDLDIIDSSSEFSPAMSNHPTFGRQLL